MAWAEMMQVRSVNMRHALLAGGALLIMGGALSPASAEPAAAMPAIVADPAVRAATPLPDFSYAGYGFGLAAIPADTGTVIDVADHGAIADDGKDDTQAVLSALALAAAASGKVTVHFPKGRIQISGVLPIERSDLVLDGSGEGDGGTELYFPRPLKIADTSSREDDLRAYMVREKKFQVEPDQNINSLFSEYSWSGGFLFVGPPGTRPVFYDPKLDKRDPVLTNAVAGRQFERTLTVADTASLKVGQVVQLQWFATEGQGSAIITSLYGDTDLPIGSHHWSFANRPVVGQSTRIVAIRGRQLTLGDPLLHDVSARQPAVVANWQHLHNVGIQNMKLTFPDSPWFGHHLEQGYNGIYMTGVFDGWIRNLIVHNADSAVLTDNAASLTISNIITTGERTAHYSVHVGAVHNVLVSDLTVRNPVVHPLSVNTRSTRSVYQRAIVARQAVLDQHSGSNHQNLFDQVTLTIDPVRDTAGQWSYQLWQGGGAPYWKPGHGRYNTHWNIRLVMPETLPADAAPVRITSGLEGPGARIVRVYGNRPLAVSYRPEAYVEGVNDPTTSVPSLYEYQRAKRRPSLFKPAP